MVYCAHLCQVTSKMLLPKILHVLAVFLSISAVNTKFPSTKSERDKSGIDSRCLDCICQKESNCNHDEGCKQVNGVDACGPYHINQTYFEDCCDLLDMSNCDSDSNWRRCAQDFTCATRCVQVRCANAKKSIILSIVARI